MSLVKVNLLLIVIALMVAQLGETIYLPVLKEIQESFQAEVYQVQLLLPLFLWSFGISQWWYGPLADAYGRKPILIQAFIQLMGATFLAWLASSMMMLHLAFLWMGIAMGASGALVRIVPRDLFSGPALYQAFAIISAATVVVPMLAPLVGAYLSSAWGWRSVFFLFGSLGAIFLCVAAYFFTETYAPQKHQHPIHNTLLIYRDLLKQPIYRACLIIATINMAIIMLYETAAPILLQTVYQFSVKSYAWFMLYPAFFYLIGTLFAGYGIRFYSVKVWMRSAHVVMIATMIVMGFYVALINFVPPLMIVLLWVALLSLTSGLVFALSIAHAQAVQEHHVAHSGALLGGIQNCGAGALSGLAAYTTSLNFDTLLTWIFLWSVFSMKAAWSLTVPEISEG